MSDQDLEESRNRLLQLRAELQSVAVTGNQSSEVVELDQSRVGRLSRMDALQAQAMSQASGRRRQLMLRKITAALLRLDNGDYGYCLSCEEAIVPKRLAIDPTATLCVACAERGEQ